MGATMVRQDQSLVMRAILFVFGMLILILAFLFLIPFASNSSLVTLFATIDAAVLYTVALGPVLLGGVFEALSSGRRVTPSIGFVGIGAWIYILASIAVIAVLIIHKDPPINVLLVVQLAALFVLGVSAVVGRQVNDQVEAVETAEQAILYPIKEVRSAAEQLAIKVSAQSLPEGEASRQLVQDVQKLADELRYISPSTAPEAASLDNGILSYVNALSACLGTGAVGPSQVQSASELVRDALTLVARRKAIRN